MTCEMHASLPSSLRHYLAVSLLVAGVHAFSDTTLCGQYENVTDPSAEYTCKLSHLFTIEVTYIGPYADELQ